PGINMVLNTGEITYESEEGFKISADTDQTLSQLKQSFTSHAQGVAIIVDGQQLGVAKDQETAESILNRLQSAYAPELVEEKKSLAVSTMSFSTASAAQTEDVSVAEEEATPSKMVTEVAFVEEVAVNGIETSPDSIEDEDEIYKRILQGSTKPTKYV